MQKIVITGGPCSGKTTLINLLKKSGECVLNESATTLIDQHLKHKDGILPWTKFEEFEELLIDFQISKEKELSELDVNRYFLDRGLIDVLAYYEFNRIEIPPNVLSKVKSIRKYDKVFFLETLPEKHWNNHVHNFKRFVSYSDGIDISGIILKKYIELDYVPVKILVSSMNDRYVEVLKHL